MIFEVLASDDAAEQERLAGTRAVIAAQTRAKDSFGRYVDAAANQEEREARLSVISSDLEQMLQAVAEEYGFENTEHLRNAATAVLGGGHASGCDCGFCKNKGKGFGDDKDDSDDDGDDDDMDKESSVKTACSCCSDCKGEDCDCSCDDCKGHKMSKTANKYIKKRGDKWVIVQKGTGKVLSTHDSEEKANESFSAMEANKHGHSVYPRVTPEFPWEKVAAEVEDGDSYQGERLDLGASKDGLEDKGSPEIDKSKSGDETGWDLKPIDVDSQRHQLEKQDASAPADYDNSDFDPSSPVRDRIDADKPLQPEHNVADNTSTWTGTEGQAAPVTSAVLAKWSVLKA